MRSFMGRRGPRVVGDLYIHPRQDVGTLDRDSDSEDEGIESDDPETPSPTQTTFPTNSPTSSPSETGRLAGLPSVTVNPGSETALPQTSPNSGELGASVGFAQNKVQEPELSQNADQSGQMSRSVVIAMGTIIGLAVLAIVIFTLWICRRRRNRANAKRTSKLRPFLCRRDSTYQPGMPAAPPDAKTQSKVMDDIIAAAYAAENGYAWETGSKRSSGSSLWREKQEASAQFASRKPNEDSKSLYVRQITSGFWRKSPQEGAGNIRAPPSVAGKTEMTSQSGATESTWNTWGVAQHPKKPKEDWIKRCIRLGGAK